MAKKKVDVFNGHYTSKNEDPFFHDQPPLEFIEDLKKDNIWENDRGSFFLLLLGQMSAARALTIRASLAVKRSSNQN